MSTQKKIEWVLRIGVFGEFFGHGIFALQGKEQWVGWISQMTGADATLAAQLLFAVGAFDILASVVILVKPMRPILYWAIFWGFWTALVRPLVGQPVWDFVERWANWAAPLALLLVLKETQGKNTSRSVASAKT